jgi:hypothetical protein
MKKDDIRVVLLYYKNIIFIKKVIRPYSRNKRIEYGYEIYDVDGNKKEYIHNDNNPAVIQYSGNKISEYQYWKHNKLHREYGPAIIKINDEHQIDKEIWYHNGKKLTSDEIDIIKKYIFKIKKIYKIYCKFK